MACNLKTTKLFDCVLIGACAVIGKKKKMVVNLGTVNILASIFFLILKGPFKIGAENKARQFM